MGGDLEVQRLSLSSAGYLYERRGATDRQQASETTEQRSLRVAPGQLVVNPMWLTGGSIAVSDMDGAVSPDYRVFAPRDDLVYPRYLHHLLRSQPYRDQYNLFVRANTTFDRRIQQGDLDQLPLWLPPLPEQRAIADFLDDRLARIDHIVDAREQQIALLAEGLRAESERTFAEDLIANAPRLRLGAMCSFFTDGDWIESPQIQNEGVRLIQTGNVGVGEYKEQGFRYISEETFVQLKCTSVHEGDVLISRLASPVGRACLCPDVGPAIASVDVSIARPQTWMDPRFMVEFLSSPRHLADTDELARGSTMQRVSRGQLSSVRIPRPELHVQERVGLHLVKERRAAAERTAQVQRGIQLLAEYKQALVTATLLGEIDVATAGSGIPG